MNTFKKIITLSSLCLGLILFTMADATAQDGDFDPPFSQGDVVINAGIGLGTTYSWGGGLGLPIGGGVEFGVADLETGTIGVGGSVGYVGGTGLSILYIGGKGSYHYPFENSPDLDVYGGLSLLYRNFSWDSSFIQSSSGLVVGFHLGGRYYFADNIGAYAELGNNWAWLNAGIVFKL
ncbi:MAG: hypothetical protein U5K31_04065 [Balneolaceae bacterium]|nr:hypothetical protein [Balneolaceae bacterium]